MNVPYNVVKKRRREYCFSAMHAAVDLPVEYLPLLEYEVKRVCREFNSHLPKQGREPLPRFEDLPKETQQQLL